MNILFICKYNRFRSKIAESYFNLKKNNDNFLAKSAGIFLDESSPALNEIETAKTFDIAIEQNFQGVSLPLLDWADIIVIVADNVPKELFRMNAGYNKEIIVFGITDDYQSNGDKIRNIVELIIGKVDEFLEQLNLRNDEGSLGEREDEE